jgi:hypothetical protein
MNTIPIRLFVVIAALLSLWLLPSVEAAAPGHAILFDSRQETSETRISLADLGSELPADWSDYEALVLEVRASSPQRIQFKIFSGAEGKYSRVLFQPYPGAWLRVALPVAMLSAAPTSGYDMASVGNRSRPGYFLGLWGPFVPLKAVTAVAFTMEKPIGSPRLEIRSALLTKQSPGDAVLEPLPLVDEFGQWIQNDWPGKAHSVEDLAAAWKQEAASLVNRSTNLCRFGGYLNTQAKATGYFRVEQIDGKWWFVDPDGHLFLSVGSDVIGPEMVTRRAGREAFFRQTPPPSLASNRLVEDPGVSFFTWNIARRFGEHWRSEWVAFTLRRLDDWGLNTVANWSNPMLWNAGKKAYAIPLGRWDTGRTYLGLPDVYSDEFARQVDAAARRQCEPHKDDPWLLGYFTANEPPFPQKELQTAELILSGPDTATRRHLEQALAAGDTPDRRKQFIAEAFDRYIQLTSQAIKKYDPNHLNLGMRSGGRPTESEIRVARAFDVYSVNIYDYQVSTERMKQISQLTGKPVIIGEFHFGVPGRGLAASLVQVKNQAERGVAYRYYLEQAFAMPSLIGTHWFQWADQPPTGRFDGENYNIGLVDVTDRPYREMVEAMKATHQRLQDVHSGRVEPFSQKALVH